MTAIGMLLAASAWPGDCQAEQGAPAWGGRELCDTVAKKMERQRDTARAWTS
jgi:hypothetical protein